jgi:hypothetical protein
MWILSTAPLIPLGVAADLGRMKNVLPSIFTPQDLLQISVSFARYLCSLKANTLDD